MGTKGVISKAAKWSLVAAAFALYYYNFDTIYPHFGISALFLAFFPVILASLFFGIRGFVPAALAALVINYNFRVGIGQGTFKAMLGQTPGAAVALLIFGFLWWIERQNEKIKAESESRRDSEERFRGLFENTPNAVMYCDADTLLFEEANPACLKMLGYHRDEMIGLTPIDISAEPEKSSAAVKALGRAGTNYVPLRYFKKKDGQIFPGEVFAGSFMLKGRKKLIGVVIDLTERKRYEEELLKAKNRAEEATMLKDKFVSLVSHDLKSPLATMLGFIAILQNDFGRLSEHQIGLVLNSAASSGNEMRTLIDNILEVSSLRAGKVNVKKRFIDASLAVQNVMSAIWPAADEKSILLSSDVPPKTRVYADQAILEHVIRNLLSNAIKFCNANDEITVFIPPGEPSTISVSDTGVGVDPALKDCLFNFDKKTTLPGTAGEKGTGLGLPLAAEMAGILGGTLSLADNLPKGSVFSLRLPHVEPAVLFVGEDGSGDLKNHIAGEGIKFSATRDEVAASGLIEKEQPNLIIIDLTSMEKAGFDLMEKIKKADPHLPLIAITADRGMETRERIILAGADDFATKPVDHDDFIPRVLRLL